MDRDLQRGASDNVLRHSYDSNRRGPAPAICAATMLVCALGCAPISERSNQNQFQAVASAAKHNHRSRRHRPQSRSENWLDAPADDRAVELVTHDTLAIESTPSISDRFDRLTLQDVIAHARSNHPMAIASRRLVEQAKSAVPVAGAKVNPEFVFDVETPVHDRNDATEISTRLTFPIGQLNVRRSLVRAARAEVSAAIAAHRATLHQISSTALTASIQLSYLQHRIQLDERNKQLTADRVGLLSPEVRDGDTVSNLVDYVRASEESQRAARAYFDTRVELDRARLALAEAMGVELQYHTESIDTLSVDTPLADASQPLPKLDDVIAAALAESEAITAAQAATQKGWIDLEAARTGIVPMEAGPLYQDRLGRDDDSIGVRFQSDLPVHSSKRDRVRAAGIMAQVLEDQVKLKRHEIANATARDYRELTAVADQLRQFRSDSFIDDQNAILQNVTTKNLMAGDETIQIELAILDRRRDELDLEYRFATLKSNLRLHAFDTAPVHIESIQ